MVTVIVTVMGIVMVTGDIRYTDTKKYDGNDNENRTKNDTEKKNKVLLTGPPGPIRPYRAVLGRPIWVGPVRAGDDLGRAGADISRYE